jgi:uncharacterized protein YkwD
MASPTPLRRLLQLGPALAAALALAALGLACSSGRSPTDPKEPAVADVEALSFQLLNETRAEEGVGQLGFNQSLALAARRHSQAMRDQGFFSHIQPDGSDPGDRIAAVGVTFTVAAENIVQVSHPIDPASLAHRELLKSVEHRFNILDPEFTQAGVGAAQSGETWWITQLFVKP